MLCSHFSLQFSADSLMRPQIHHFLHQNSSIKQSLHFLTPSPPKTPLYFQFVTGSPLALSDSAKRDMGKIGLLVKYDGHWDGTQFMGSNPFGVCVSTEEKHDQLLEKIYQRVGVDRDRFEFRLSTMVNTKMEKIILPILCDGDVEFVLVNTECTPVVFVEVVERPVAVPREATPVNPTSFSKDAEDKAVGGKGKEGVGKPSECGTSRNTDKRRKRKSKGESSESYEAGNGSKLSNASEEELEEVDPDLLYYPRPEFSDFDKDRAENCFAVNQVWAIYDSCNIMPRKYVRIKKVYSHRFKIQFTSLVPDPDDESEKNWFGVDLPVACGKFMKGLFEQTKDLLLFSHQVSFIRDVGRNSCLIYPDRGETWALFRDWDIKWSDNPEEHQPPYQYEYVEVLTGFKENVGIGVAYLGKVEGFVCVFQRIAKNGVLSFNIAPGELYRFSHRIPWSRMTGKERFGVPEGSFELDPAALPISDRI